MATAGGGLMVAGVEYAPSATCKNKMYVFEKAHTWWARGTLDTTTITIKTPTKVVSTRAEQERSTHSSQPSKPGRIPSISHRPSELWRPITMS